MGFNITEALLRPVLRSPQAQAAIAGLRFAGDNLGLPTGTFADAADMGTRALSGDNSKFNPENFSKATQESFKTAIDNAVARGVRPNEDGYVAVDYDDYPSRLSSLVSGRMNAKNNPNGSTSIDPNERYDFNASRTNDREEYLDNLNGAMSSAFSDAIGADTRSGKLEGVMRVAANAPDYLNFYTGAGTEGLNIGGKFGKPKPPSKQSTTKNTPASPSPSPSISNYVVKGGDTLTSIANSMGVDVNDLAKRNNIANANLINIGQTIV
jgi:LysM repeat protein